MTTAQSKKPDLKFQLKGIEILDFELKQPQFELPPVITYHFNLRVQQKVNNKDKLVIVIVNVTILHEDKVTKLGNIGVSCIFFIENYDDVFEKKRGNEISVPKEYANVLNSISISTTRGVMFTCFRGTFLHNAFLPVIDPKSLVLEEENASK